jgi:hypothetical protein
MFTMELNRIGSNIFGLGYARDGPTGNGGGWSFPPSNRHLGGWFWSRELGLAGISRKTTAHIASCPPIIIIIKLWRLVNSFSAFWSARYVVSESDDDDSQAAILASPALIPTF